MSVTHCQADFIERQLYRESFTSSTPGKSNRDCQPGSLGFSPSICKALNPPFLPFFCDLIGLATLPRLTLGAVGLMNVQKVLKMLGCKFCFQCFHSGFRKGPSY